MVPKAILSILCFFLLGSALPKSSLEQYNYNIDHCLITDRIHSRAEAIRWASAIKITYPLPPKWFNHRLLMYIIKECDNTHVPYLLVFKLIELESRWHCEDNSANRDNKGKLLSVDYGLMQINSLNIDNFITLYKDRNRSAKSYDIKHNSYDNAQIGIRHLADLYNKFRSWPLAIGAYNAGYTSIAKGYCPDSTKSYIKYIIPVDKWWAFPTNVIVSRPDQNKID